MPSLTAAAASKISLWYPPSQLCTVLRRCVMQYFRWRDVIRQLWLPAVYYPIVSSTLLLFFQQSLPVTPFTTVNHNFVRRFSNDSWQSRKAMTQFPRIQNGQTVTGVWGRTTFELIQGGIKRDCGMLLLLFFKRWWRWCRWTRQTGHATLTAEK